jgi:hypothetical protein
LIDNVINEQKAEKHLKKQKTIIFVISWSIPLFIACVCILLFPQLNEFVRDLFKHYLGLAMLFGILIIHNLIKKYLKDYIE